MQRRTTIAVVLLIFSPLALSVSACGGGGGGDGGGGPAVGTVVFTTDRNGNDELFRMNADGTGLLNLTNNLAADNDAAVSPNGSALRSPALAVATARSSA